MLKNLMIAGVGGAIGTMLRFAVYALYKNPHFPFATLLVNIAGSLIIGLLLGFSIRDNNFENNWKVFLSTGICGGFTTFSAFSLENLQMLQHGKYFLSMLYIFISIITCIFAAWAGYKLAVN